MESPVLENELLLALRLCQEIAANLAGISRWVEAQQLLYTLH